MLTGGAPLLGQDNLGQVAVEPTDLPEAGVRGPARTAALCMGAWVLLSSCPCPAPQLAAAVSGVMCSSLHGPAPDSRGLCWDPLPESCPKLYVASLPPQRPLLPLLQ